MNKKNMKNNAFGLVVLCTVVGTVGHLSAGYANRGMANAVVNDRMVNDAGMINDGGMINDSGMVNDGAVRGPVARTGEVAGVAVAETAAVPGRVLGGITGNRRDVRERAPRSRVSTNATESNCGICKKREPRAPRVRREKKCCPKPFSCCDKEPRKPKAPKEDNGCGLFKCREKEPKAPQVKKEKSGCGLFRCND